MSGTERGANRRGKNSPVIRARIEEFRVLTANHIDPDSLLEHNNKLKAERLKLAGGVLGLFLVFASVYAGGPHKLISRLASGVENVPEKISDGFDRSESLWESRDTRLESEEHLMVAFQSGVRPLVPVYKSNKNVNSVIGYIDPGTVVLGLRVEGSAYSTSLPDRDQTDSFRGVWFKSDRLILTYDEEGNPLNLELDFAKIKEDSPYFLRNKDIIEPTAEEAAMYYSE